MSRLDELRLDVGELQTLETQAQRPKVKEMLGLEIRKLQTLIVDLNVKQQASEGASQITDKPVAVVTAVTRRPLKEITTYGWDQSEKFMKIYVTINGIQNHSTDCITCSFKNRSFKLLVENLEGKDHVVHVANLHDDIVIEDSYHKVKTDMILIMLKKQNIGKTWPYVIIKKEEKKKEPKKPPAAGEEGDPGAGLMDMLKQMYDDGDDEMKKTIAKAWTESRGKQTEMPPM